MGFQNLAGEIYSQLESLHDLAMVWLTVILVVVTIISYGALQNTKGSITPDSELLEKTWTILPILILLSIALPSIHLLCLQDAMGQAPDFTTKVISNQWNWQSESEDSSDHLLDVDEVDNLASYEIPLVAGNGTTRVLVTSTDVLHSLGVPSLGVKLDSVPGRLNATTMEVSSPGLFVGSCYELCGSGHSAMPVNILAV